MDKIEEVLTRRVDKIYPSKIALEKVLRSQKKIKLYLGIDPTAQNLHLGHTVQLRKLQEFVELGHQVILLFGTGTVLVGDPSERATSRKLITEKEINKNIATWKEQIKPIIDLKKVSVKYNGDWLTKLTLKDLIFIGSKISAIQLFKRDNFTRRIKAGDTVWYHETMYPLLQGYDSVVMNVDLEVGGTDQTFNMLIGRQLQRKINRKEKFVLTNRMILGTNGKPMSKTAGNCILLTDNPKNMYAKIMSVNDEFIPEYFEFFTTIALEQIAKIKKDLKSGQINPMDYKKKLAYDITSQFYGSSKAKEAQNEFEQVFQGRGVPSIIKNVKLKIKNKDWNIVDLLVELKLAASRSEAKRLVMQKAVKINNQLTISNQQLTINSGDIIKVGKRKWLKVYN